MNTNVFRAAQVPSTRSPQRGGEGDGQTEGTEKLIRTFRGILNKLTPEMFECLMNQVDELNIDTEERLNAVVELIVAKALLEQSYSATYAKMCHHLKRLRVSSQSGNDFIYFHNVLHTRCRVEFRNRGLLPEQENDASVDQEDLEQTKLKARVRLLGTVRFIGELFKLKMISEGIVHTCIGKLLQEESEESLECMCKLLTTVGKDLDTDTEIPKVNSYCGLISNLMKKKLPSRIKFMLQDVLALRENDWVPRRRDEGPKPIQQLHQEAKEAEEREMLQVKKAISGRFNRDFRRNCDGDQKLRSHRGSSSTFGSPKGEPVVHLDEQLHRRAQNKEINTVTVEHKTPPKGGSSSKPSCLCDEEEVYRGLKRLLQEKPVNDQIEEWIQNTLNDRQRSSVGFVRALMRAVCQSVIVDCGVYTLNTYELLQRVSLLKRFITDGQKELVALNTVRLLVVHMDQPDGLLRMFFDVLLDEEVIQDQTFFKWKSSAAHVTSVSNFFTWLQEANKHIK